MLRTSFQRLAILAMLLCLALPARSQPSLPPSEMDVRMGAEQERAILDDPAQYPLLDRRVHPEVYAYLEQVKGQILSTGKVRHAQDFPWKIHVVDDPRTVNAFATPGGYLYVYTGLILYAANEAELAGVMAHEIAHADLRHAAQALNTRFQGRQGMMRRRRGGREGPGKLRSLRFSRKQELEADEQSAVYISATNYHAPSMVGFLERMASEKTEHTPIFLSSHPSDKKRIQLLTRTIESLSSQGSAIGAIKHMAICKELTD